MSWGIVTTESSNNEIFSKDEIGRTKKITLGDSQYALLKMVPYWKEERLYAHTTKTKISFNDLLTIYLSDKTFKQIFTLNNKLIIQKDETFNLFSLKTVADSLRLLGIIELTFFGLGVHDCLFVPDTNTVQRKQLYNLLETRGYSREFLRKQFTY